MTTIELKKKAREILLRPVEEQRAALRSVCAILADDDSLPNEEELVQLMTWVLNGFSRRS